MRLMSIEISSLPVQYMHRYINLSELETRFRLRSKAPYFLMDFLLFIPHIAAHKRRGRSHSKREGIAALTEVKNEITMQSIKCFIVLCTENERYS